MADIAGKNGQREEFRVVGKPNKPGILSYALASGVAKFGADYVMPDMLHAKFLRSPYAHARINSINTEKAWKVPGVVDIVLWDDPDLMGLGGMPFGPPKSYLGNVAHQENQEVGAIVVAESEDACETALRALEVDWEVLPFIVNLREGGTNPDLPVIRTPEDEGGGDMFGGRPSHETDHPVAVVRRRLLGEVLDEFAVQPVFSRIVIVQDAQDVEQRGLAGAGRAHDGHELAPFDSQVDSLEHMQRLPVIVGLVDTFQFNQHFSCISMLLHCKYRWFFLTGKIFLQKL